MPIDRSDRSDGSDGPAAEHDRLAGLYRLDLLDGEPDERFDRITRIASRAFAAPIALVTLLDDDDQQFCSALGTELTGTSRTDSFCTHAIVNPDDVLVVNDTHLDPTFAGNPLVTDSPHIRFYAGAPIATTTGHPIGTLCILDVVPREFTDDDESILRDLAGLVQREILHTTLGMTDSLTGLANRRAFVAAAERFLTLGRRRAEPVSMIFADVNELKPVNDVYGHVDGDALIKRAAESIAEATRTSDIVARLGGDEFAVLLYDVDARGVAEVIAKIEQHVALNNVDAPAHLGLSIALGGATARPGDTVTELIVRADAAMFDAKRASHPRNDTDRAAPHR